MESMDFVAYDGYGRHANELGSEDTLRKAKKIPGAVAIDAFDKRGRWICGWELRNNKWIRVNE